MCQVGERESDLPGYPGGTVNAYASVAANVLYSNWSANNGTLSDYAYTRGTYDIEIHVGYAHLLLSPLFSLTFLCSSRFSALVK